MPCVSRSAASGRVTCPVAAGSWSRLSVTVLPGAIRMGSMRSLMNRRRSSMALKNARIRRAAAGFLPARPWNSAGQARYRHSWAGATGGQAARGEGPQDLEPEFGGRIGRDWRDSVPWWPPEPARPPGSPSVLLVVLDDVGYAQLGCYGSDIET